MDCVVSPVDHRYVENNSLHAIATEPPTSGSNIDEGVSVGVGFLLTTISSVS